ncbi:MAG TPA: hypothetical protein VFS16_06865 [Acidimicrobiia bacterium]|nr:hypothetical protein [Acidimicrobiia bacterium]
MPRQPPRFLPTVALAVLWIALYFVWIAVRPQPAVVTRQSGRPASATTSTTVPPLIKFKP